MTASLHQYLIVCPLVFLAGFIDAIAGGGGLVSLPAYLISGLPVHFAIGTNKLSSGMGTALATWKYAKNGYIAWRLALWCAVCALVGSHTGARLALLLNDHIFKCIMLVLLPLTAIYLLRRNTFVAEREPFSTRKTMLLSMVIALTIGLYDGFYGPGTGTFLLLLLTGIAHMQLHLANGTTKVINLTTNVSALIVFLYNGKVLMALGLTAGIFSIAGNYVGALCFARNSASIAKPLMILVLLLFFFKVLFEVLPS